MGIRYYVSCPDCRTRMRRTGPKREVARTVNGEPLYAREYECSGCGAFFVYDVSKAFFHRGKL